MWLFNSGYRLEMQRMIVQDVDQAEDIAYDNSEQFIFQLGFFALDKPGGVTVKFVGYDIMEYMEKIE
ncbi:hypothetical protein VNO78_21820 [Psophocarpus tetragonolobus]|uniref:Uncharacterized protein n=1 Tax=Psophocarpus tetragonolobus TaxID=3891 RepID=A0AAN9SDA8_PSOTE